MSGIFIVNEFGIIGGICSLIAVLLAGHQIFMHLYFFKEPKFQLYIVRILLMVPVMIINNKIYSIQSWFSLIMPKYSLFFNTVRDCYESYVLYIFLQLLIQYLKGEDILSRQIDKERKRLNHPWPFNYYLSYSIINRAFFRKLKQGVLQFVLIKPFTAILSLILMHYGYLEEGDFSLKNSYIYISIINNISVSVFNLVKQISLYCLVLFYMGFEDKLHSFRPFSKFLCIKFIIFFSFWQSCFLIILTKFQFFSHEKACFMQDMLICLEMVVAAIAHSFAFSYKDFVDYSRLQSPMRNLGKVLNVGDILVDAENTFISEMEDDYKIEEMRFLPKKKKCSDELNDI